MTRSSSSRVLERLQTSGDRAARLARQCRGATNARLAIAKLWQIATTMELVRRLPDDADANGLDEVIADVENVIRHLERSMVPNADDRELELAHATSQRVLLGVSHLIAWDYERVWPPVE